MDRGAWWATVLQGHKESDVTEHTKELYKTETFNSVQFSHSVMSDSFDPMDSVASQAALSWGFSGKNTGVGFHFFLQGIFSTQGLNPRLLLRQVGCLPLEPPGKLSGGDEKF